MVSSGVGDSMVSSGLGDTEYLSLEDLVCLTESALGGGGVTEEKQVSAAVASLRREEMDFEVAVTGAAFGELQIVQRHGSQGPLKAVTLIARVFARMSPEQKQALVETYGSLPLPLLLSFHLHIPTHAHTRNHTHSLTY